VFTPCGTYPKFSDTFCKKEFHLPDKLKRVADETTKQGRKVVAPQESEARALAEKNQQIDEYQNTYGPILGTMGAPRSSSGGMSAPPKPIQEVDKVLPSARYGSRPGEQRLDVSDMMRPLGQDQPVERVRMVPAAAAIKLPLYDDGGPVDPNNLPQEAFDPSAANVVGQSAIDSAATAAPESGLHKVMDRVGRAGKAMDGGDPSSMPGQTANTRQYGVQGLDRNYMTPMYDDGGKVSMNNKTRGFGSPRIPDHILERIPGTRQFKALNAVPSARAVPLYDDGGPVKDDPNDGHHQMAILEEGERVLTPEQNAAYEQEHGAPLNAPGRVLQQPNPPVQPMMDTEHTADQPVGQGKMDTSNSPASEVAPPTMRTMSTTTPRSLGQPSVPGLLPSARQPQPIASNVSAPAPTGAAPNGAVDENRIPINFQPGKDTSLPTAKPVFTHDQLEAERSALRQQMMDAALGKDNNGKFDHVAFGNAKVALAELEKAHHWGTPGNHEGIGGKIIHGLATAGNIAGEAIIPGVMPAIPGSRANLNLQAAQGEHEINEGLAQQEKQAETGLKEAQTSMAGRPKDPKAGMAAEQFNMNHSVPGSPEYLRAQENYAAYKQMNDQLEQAKLGGKREKLPEQIDAQTKKVLSLPEGSPERQQAEADLAFMQKQMQQGKALTDRRREIIDHAKAMGLDPDDPTQYDKAMQDYEAKKSGARAEGSFPTWQHKAEISNRLTTERALLVQQNADANQFGLKAAELQMKGDQDYIKAMGHINLINKALAASDQSQVAANLVPLFGTLNVVHDVGGISRLNKQELDSMAPGHGSLTRWLAANWDRVVVGELPDGYQAEVAGLMKDLSANVDENHNSYTKAVDQNFRQNAQTPQVKNNPKGGTSVTPKKATPNAPPPLPTKGVLPRPSGATQVGYDAITGTYHYADKSGRSLGPYSK
jgi:hypothetical protein